MSSIPQGALCSVLCTPVVLHSQPQAHVPSLSSTASHMHQCAVPGQSACRRGTCQSSNTLQCDCQEGVAPDILHSGNATHTATAFIRFTSAWAALTVVCGCARPVAEHLLCLVLLPGGGTVDITVHTVVEKHGQLVLKEAVTGIAGFHGSTQVMYGWVPHMVTVANSLVLAADQRWVVAPSVDFLWLPASFLRVSTAACGFLWRSVA
jgi:hypothetical protein